MKITWEDRKNYGAIDNKPLQSKPALSFEYAWFLVTDDTAQFVESHEEGFYNRDMSPEQKQEVLYWYAAWTPPMPHESPPMTSAREIAKQARQVAVENITVTTSAGNTFDGDETSQTRMARAILVLSSGAASTVTWVLADNTVIQATAAELTEALAKAGAAQAAMWVI